MATRSHRTFKSQTATAVVLQSHPARLRRGFTLLELLVVLGVIGIVAAMLLPALAHSKARAQAIVCMNNYKQLALGWTMYSSDNNERLVYNLGGSADRQSFAPDNQPNWVNNIMTWDLSPDNTNTAFAYSSMLGQWVSYSGNAFKCPADKFLSPAQQGAGWSARVRSVSMNAMVGNPGQLLQNDVNVNNAAYRQFLKESDIPNPSTIFVFLDEHPDSINDGYFLITPGTNEYDLEWVDLPASYHNGGGSFCFADGHTEIHHWLDPVTVQPVLYDDAMLPLPVRPTEAQDFDWVLQRSSVEMQPADTIADAW